MKKTIAVTLLLSLVCGCQIFQPRGVETEFVQEDSKLYFLITNNSDKEIVLENLSGGVKFIKSFKTDGEVVGEEGPFEGKSVSYPKFMIATKDPFIIGVGKSHRFNISIFRAPVEDETANVHVLLIGKDLKIENEIEIKN